VTLHLTDEQRALLAGDAGPATQLAMRLVTRMADVSGATTLLPISRAHVDGCLYHGQVSLDFARTLAEGGGQVRVPTTLNVGIVDLLHPELFRGPPEVAAAGREMMRHYRALGCRQTWTCAPYQLADRPQPGEQVAWAESNAIVFCNSVLGARTERYGDFMDIAAALTGWVPASGLHTDAGRRARVVVSVEGIPSAVRTRDIFFAALGQFVGTHVAGAIPAIAGLDSASEDQLKALGAVAASAGAVAMFHVVGITPEAGSLDEALGGEPPERVLAFDGRALAAALAALSSPRTQRLGAISIGTPHFSLAEFDELRTRLAGRAVHEDIVFYVSTGREVLGAIAARGWDAELARLGVTIVTDTCTYITPILRAHPGAVMTNSGKWAWYAPGNLGYEVVFGTLEECVESAVRGDVWRDEALRALLGA
jgi:predicted aconitase